VLRVGAAELHPLAREIAAVPELFLALDYDGTLVPIRETPDAARPDPELSSLLGELCGLEGVHVAIVSGRSRESLAEFVGAFPLALAAEHGVWTRPLDRDWRCNVDVDSLPWREPVLKMLEEYTARTPGSRIEEKTAGLAWHYRSADRQLGAARARELRLNLVQALSQQPVTVFAGRKVVEVRPQSVDKGTAARTLVETLPRQATLVAMGDDRGDEDLFRALPPQAYTFAAGPGPTRARFRLHGPEGVRAVLWAIVDARREELNQAMVPTEPVFERPRPGA
jgi:trehalose 6-phosphate synthase/phosphatase